MYRSHSAQDSSPEAHEFYGIIKRLGDILQRRPEIDWSEDRKWCAEVLEELARGCEKSLLLEEKLSGCRYLRGGDEHLLVDYGAGEEPPRVYKVTYGENFGCKSRFIAADPDLTGKHFHAEVQSDPLFYLNRWVYLNSITGYQTRYEGILPPPVDGTLPLICVSQKRLPEINPKDEKTIEAALSLYGYVRISKDTYLEKDSHILLTDAAPRNVRINEGLPALFDVIAEKASERVVTWAEERGLLG